MGWCGWNMEIGDIDMNDDLAALETQVRALGVQVRALGDTMVECLNREVNWRVQALSSCLEAQTERARADKAESDLAALARRGPQAVASGD